MDGNNEKPATPKRTVTTPEEFEREMAHARDDENEEAAHGDMDAIMCRILCELGYGAGVDQFNAQQKWYA
jgi:hypothetical protein